MAVYVDQLISWGKTAKWRYGESCHLIADELEELHTFAKSIGMKRQWYQVSNSGVPHYDLTKGRRTEAVKFGAIELTNREFVDKTKLIER